MPKLSISCADWIEAASWGKLDQLERWVSSGALDIRYDPVRVGVSGKQGRAKIFDVCDPDKRNALFVALSSGQVGYALRLMELGRFASTRTREGRTPMHAAALLQKDCPQVIPLLAAQGHGLNVADNKGMTPLLLAINDKRLDAVRALLAAGASANETPAGTAPLARAVAKGQAGMVELLLAAGADPNARGGRFDASPLHTLAANWDQDDDRTETAAVRILRMLLEAGADPEATITENGKVMTVEDTFYTPGGAAQLRRMVVDLHAKHMDAQTQPASAPGRSVRL